MTRPRFRLPRPKFTRDATLFLFGLSGLAYETLIGGAERPTLIIAFTGMLGLPLFIRNDEARRDEDPPSPPPVPVSPTPTPPPVSSTGEPAGS